MTSSGGDPKSNLQNTLQKLHFFAQLNNLKNKLDEDHPKRKEIEILQQKIKHKRSRIEHVTRHS